MLKPARTLLRSQSLLRILTARDLKARYRGSLLGFFWSLVNPLLLLAVYTFVFGFIFQPRIEGMDPYALFLITGLFPWVWVSTSILEGTTSLTANSALIRKAAFPAELLPTVPVVSNLLHFVLALPILAAALGTGRAFGYEIGGWAAVLLPLVVVVQIPMVAGLSLGLAALHAHFKDVRDLVTHAMTLLFFLTPILYAIEAIPYEAVRTAIRINPFTPFFLAYQDVLFHGVAPPPGLWLHMALLSLAVWALGAWVFERLSETLVEAV